jgi:hypothetical protein
MHAESESVDVNLDGRDAGPLPAAQGAASEVYRVYRSARRCSDQQTLLFKAYRA